MNKGGVPYAISNPPGSTKDWVGTPGAYSTNFNTNMKGKVEHFDVYGEVHTKYSQVYWTRNSPINLPPDLVARFAGKVMAITGYEVDQVTHSGPQPNSTTVGDTLGGFSCYPDCSATDKSIPIYHAYNHHYFGWLTGSDSQVYDLDKKSEIKYPNPSTTGIRDLPNTHGFPTNIVFKENPGGEFRKSYHGYPSGTAQLLHSPTQWLVEPMQIDTHNRDYDINDPVGYKPSFMPKTDQNEMTDLAGSLSPLIECPCSDRITKRTVSSPTILTSGKCQTPLTSEVACSAAIASIGKVSSSSTVSDTSKPAGCTMVPNATSNSFAAIFNTATSTVTCPNATSFNGQSELGSLTNLAITHDGTEATITLSGPAGNWFGVGFNAKAMADSPYAIIIDGSGNATERKLGNHDPGSVLTPSVKVLSSVVSSGVRTVKLSRPVAGATTDHYSIPTVPGTINVITAVGNSPTLSYHKARTGAQFLLLPAGTDSCVCTPTTTNFINYMNQSNTEFEGYSCADEPRGDMLKHGDGTGRNVENNACKVQTYHGGLQCCKHKFFLTDLAQDHLIPNKTDVYFLKWRYYFQEYVPATPAVPASHRHLHHFVFLIDANVNDYEEDNANYGTASMGKISAHLTVQEMGIEDIPKAFTRITPFMMSPHFHAPNGIREELWNADTGEILCNATSSYGSSATEVFNEPNYVAINPCIFGYQAGLQKPFSLLPGTNVTAIKYFNNTYRHLGQMAQWTGLFVYDTDPYFYV